MADYTTNQQQGGDVLMLMIDNHGEVFESDGFIQMTGGPETAIPLSLVGGNREDDGSDSTAKKQWWGNEDEPEENQYRSRFQYLAKSGVPITSATATDLVEAAQDILDRDYVQGGFAESVTLDTFELVTPKHFRIAGSMVMVDGSITPLVIDREV